MGYCWSREISFSIAGVQFVALYNLLHYLQHIPIFFIMRKYPCQRIFIVSHSFIISGPMLHRFVHSWCFKHKVVLVHPFKPDLTITFELSCTFISANALLFYLELYNVPTLLLQRNDPDPAAKAAAATVLASKLGADSGLKVYMGDDTKFNPPARMSSDVEHLQSSGLRKCKQSVSRSSSAESAVLHQLEEEMMQYAGPEGPEMSKHNQLIVEHQNPTSLHTQDGGWIARIAALLVGEDPT